MLIAKPAGAVNGQDDLYPMLSHEEELQGESNSISNQKRILESYAKQNGFRNLRWYTEMIFRQKGVLSNLRKVTKYLSHISKGVGDN